MMETEPKFKLASHRAGGLDRRAGFSFVEILFAVMILGLGFIMVAALFPVAIVQTQGTNEQTSGTTISRGGTFYLQRISSRLVLPDTGDAVVPVPAAVRDFIGGNLTLPNDPRFGWLPLYRRANQSPFAQLIMVPFRIRNQSMYVDGVIRSKVIADFDPKLVRVQLGGLNPSVATFDTNVTTSPGFPAVGAGAYIVIANGVDSAGANAAGRIYRLGGLRPNSNNAYELSPGEDLARLDPNGNFNDADDKTTEGTNAYIAAYVVGLGLSDPVVANSGLQGLTRDVGAFTTFIRVN